MAPSHTQRYSRRTGRLGPWTALGTARGNAGLAGWRESELIQRHPVLLERLAHLCSIPLPHRSARFDLKDRGSARQRGYDARWQKVRDYHIRANPLCVKCEERGRTVVGKDVDHIIPFDGLSDPKRLDGCNLQTLCRACHNAKTARQGAR